MDSAELITAQNNVSESSLTVAAKSLYKCILNVLNQLIVLRSETKMKTTKLPEMPKYKISAYQNAKVTDADELYALNFVSEIQNQSADGFFPVPDEINFTVYDSFIYVWVTLKSSTTKYLNASRLAKNGWLLMNVNGIVNYKLTAEYKLDK